MIDLGNEGEEESMSTYEKKLSFSVSHSNVLYTIFFLGSILIICMDIIFQLVRKSYVSQITFFYLGLMIFNLCIWLDFVYGILRRKRTSENSLERGYFDDVFNYSTNFLFCLVILPFLLVKNYFIRWPDPGYSVKYLYLSNSRSPQIDVVVWSESVKANGKLSNQHPWSIHNFS